MINLSEVKVDTLRNQRSLLPRPPLSLQGHSYHATHVLDEMDMAGQRERERGEEDSSLSRRVYYRCFGKIIAVRYCM